MRRNYLKKFEFWMLRTGRLDKSGRPCEGLSPRTANNRMKKIRRILVDLGYIIPSGNSRNRRYDFQAGKKAGDIRELTMEQIFNWFKEKFPSLPDAASRFRKVDYIMAALKFTEFMHFEMNIWPRSNLDRVRSELRCPWVPPIWENKVSILPVERIDAFLEYLKPISNIHYMMFYLMRHANMRYLEVVNAKVDLETGTITQDFRNNILIIHGKGRGGLTQQRRTPFLPNQQKELLEYLEWRKTIKTNSEWLFVNQYGRKWSEHSDHFNKWLREQGEKFGFTEAELKLVSTHKVGRHAYGTDMTIKGLPERFLCDNMGIRNPRVLERYQNATDDIRVQETAKRLNAQIAPQTTCSDDRKQKLIDMLLEGKIDMEAFKIAMKAL